jgi:adenylate cyclase
MARWIFQRDRNLPLIVIILFQPVLYSLVIVALYLILSALFLDIDDIWKDGLVLQTLVFSLGMTFLFISMENVNRILGQKLMMRLITGVYHKPVREKRFVMFLDLADSTGIAEKLGDLRFHSFLQNFFNDITEPVLESKAEIYKYVGDEIILTWVRKKALKDAGVLFLYNEILGTIENKKEKYRKNFDGVVPVFRAGLHYGPLVVGEMGDFRQEIAFLGDVMNTASRIQASCKALDSGFLVSDAVLQQFHDLPDGLQARSHGTIALRGKEQKLELFSLNSG